MDLNQIFTVVQYIGTVSFSLSGTIVALQKKNDMVGTVLYALLTSFGGGMIRDITLGIRPHVLTDALTGKQALVCIAVSLIFASLCFIPKFYDFLIAHKNNFLLYFTDAIGISVFCIVGVDVALNITEGTNPSNVLIIYCGCISAVGGGILRDIFAAEIPIILRKYVYLLPVLFGTTLYVFTYDKLPGAFPMAICISVIMVIRTLAIIFKWNLPIPKGSGEKK